MFSFNKNSIKLKILQRMDLFYDIKEIKDQSGMLGWYLVFKLFLIKKSGQIYIEPITFEIMNFFADRKIIGFFNKSGFLLKQSRIGFVVDGWHTVAYVVEYVPKEENLPKVPQLRPLKKRSTATIIVQKL
jgi:hypothetical protein